MNVDVGGLFRPKAIPQQAYNDGTYLNYKLGTYNVKAIQVFDGQGWLQLPDHKVGRKDLNSTIVDSGRNAVAVTISKQIGRTQSKIGEIVFPELYAHEWQKITQLFDDGFKRPVKYYDMVKGFIVRTMYVSDRTATVYSYKDNEGAVEIYTDCALNFIDVGELN